MPSMDRHPLAMFTDKVVAKTGCKGHKWNTNRRDEGLNICDPELERFIDYRLDDVHALVEEVRRGARLRLRVTIHYDSAPSWGSYLVVVDRDIEKDRLSDERTRREFLKGVARMTETIQTRASALKSLVEGSMSEIIGSLEAYDKEEKSGKA